MRVGKTERVVYLKKGYDLRTETKTWKIGCSIAPKKRVQSAQSGGLTGSDVEMSFQGDFITEKAVHLYFSRFKFPYGVGDRGEEIFERTDVILREFPVIMKDKVSLYTWIWKNREELFKLTDITYDEYKFSIKERVLGRAIKLIGYENALKELKESKTNLTLNWKINNFIVTKYKKNISNKLFNTN